MTSAQIEVRPPADDREFDAVFETICTVFLDGNRTLAETWAESIVQAPGYHRRQVRAAFLEGRCAGAYLVHERDILLHGAVIPTGFIGAVGVREEHRHRGIGTALMHDAQDFAAQHGIGLLLLSGAYLFYDPFGYVDVFDSTSQSMARTDIGSIKADTRWHVRRAAVDDAQAILALYLRQHESYGGCTVRTVQSQQHLLSYAIREYGRGGDTRTGAAPRVAVGPDGNIGGYFAFPWGVNTWFGCEAVAPSWPAAAALLAEHASLPDGADGRSDDVIWQLPSDSATLQYINDQLPVTSAVTRRPSTGWMAVAPQVKVVLRALQAPWGVVAVNWPRRLELAIDAADPIQLGPPGTSSIRVTLSSPVLLQLLFGYRTVWWASDQEGQAIPDTAIPLLSDLMSRSHGWIAPSDGW